MATASRTWWWATIRSPTILYINKGDGTFDDQSYVSGFALNKDGREIASMGIAAGDYENNGLIDFFVTDFGDDYKVLFHNDGDASFTDVSYKAGDRADHDSVCRLGRRVSSITTTTAGSICSR